MKLHKNSVEADVKVGNSLVSIRRKGSSEVVQASILSTTPGPDGDGMKIWLDRLIHAEHETDIGGYPVNGCFVTEMIVPRT